MGKHVLVVDNDRVCVELLGDILGQEGYEVCKAYDGMEAMESLARDLPDVIFLDIIMPRIDGDLVFQYIRANPRTARIPVVILSGILVEDRENLLAMGADAYVAKGPKDSLRRNVLAILRRLESGQPPARGEVLGLDNLVPREKVKELLAVRHSRHAILEAIGEGVIEVDRRRRITSVNRAGLEILGRAELDVIGGTVTEVLTPEYRGTLEDAVVRFEAGERPAVDGMAVRYRDTVLRLGFAWMAPGDRSQGFFLILRNVTDLVQKIEELSGLNARLREMDRVRSEFLTMVSHDLHTPLTAIKGSLDVLLHEGVGVELGRELLGIAQKNTDRLFRLVSDILDLARIESGRFSMRREPFDVALGLRGAMDRLHRIAEEKQVELSLEAPEDLPLVSADGLRMDQVFTNLLSNAVKFTPSGGWVKVTVRGLATELLVDVQDSGVGIPGEHLDRVFDRFYRVPLPAGAEVEGTGLGLSICKTVLEEHGGRIWVRSAVGQGSTFSFTIPTIASVA
ncbi:MAG TPA: ATP-binding protein [Candidatus Methylomirabilis sp.]|nr:ATP-binding protein [Candidatus Methylomirabilis sp.]